LTHKNDSYRFFEALSKKIKLVYGQSTSMQI